MMIPVLTNKDRQQALGKLGQMTPAENKPLPVAACLALSAVYCRSAPKNPQGFCHVSGKA
ncbi:hypothetical protein [Alcaligenes sp. SDU_A2]|uniref:hypothetical protein n=1 Tax=Alcaligenes sp. SDU_A2 TaxID=3136634 RepID=UPI0031201F79